MQQLGKTLYHQGDLSYFEAVNKESLKNAYQRFQEEGMIIVTKTKGSLSMRITPSWMPERDSETGKLLPRGRLWDFLDQIAQSRREGCVFSLPLEEEKKRKEESTKYNSR